MKILWCWRCKMEVPMFEESEYAEAGRLYSLAFSKYRTGSISDRFKPLIDYYNSLSDFRETNPNAIMHHRVDLYGPPCENCGKPYRTPQAALCAACGNKRIEE